MKGIQHWRTTDEFEEDHKGHLVTPVNNGALLLLWCSDCHTLAEYQSVSVKFQSKEEAKAYGRELRSKGGLNG